MVAVSDLNDLNLQKKEGENNEEVSGLYYGFDCTNVESGKEVEVVPDDSCMPDDGADESAIEVFGDEGVYVCGEVGCWKDSGWDSQMANAREVRLTCGRKVMRDGEVESPRPGQIGEEVDPPGVPEEYDRGQKEGETHVIFSEADTAEQVAFGHVLRFPTQRRPADYRCELIISANGISTWFESSGIKLGASLTTDERQRAQQLLYTWRDRFVRQLKDMPVTDLVEHRIPVHQGAQPTRARDKIYTKEERDWLEINIPEMERAGIIGRSESPWSHRTKFVRKKDGGLRMVHVFCPINGATILSGYPMKRIEPVVNNLMQSGFHSYFQADAANGYWAVAMYPPHSYRTAFSTHNGQWQYLRMGQGLAGAPQTYARLKDIVSGEIPEPDPEPCLSRCTTGAFEYFVDDDFGGFPNFKSQFDFLHNHYFPQLAWAKLSLQGRKCGFFLDKISPLGYSSNGSGLRPSLDKAGAIRDYPRPTNANEVEAFVYMTIYLRQFIPGRAEHARILKEAIVYRPLHESEKNKSAQPGKRGKPVKVACGLKWGQEQERSFRAVKKAIIENVVYGGDDSKQYHLMTDASINALGGVLFQLPNLPAGTKFTVSTRAEMRVIMFISKRFLPVETRYSTKEREALVILRCLEEVRWLVLGSPFPTKVYTDHRALLGLLRKDDAYGRIVRWQVRLAEYDIEYIHIPGKENVLADGMSRIRHADGEIEGEVIEEVNEVLMTEKEKTTDGWKEWLEDPWYGEIVHYKLFGDLDGLCNDDGLPLTRHRRRLVQHKSKSYRLLNTQIPDNTISTGIRVSGTGHYTTKGPNRLVFVERNGEEAFCVRAVEVESILYQLNDCHGHFAAGVLLRTIIGRYYWPMRAKDVNVYCATCPSCQMIGPLKPSVSQLAIAHLQPLDMMGFDFVGRFPETARGNKYIIIGVDYFTRFLFGKAVPDSQGKSAVSLLMEVVKQFGWPRAVYTDNGAHFVSGEFAKVLSKLSVIHLPAPKSHPQSVGLAERYVKLLVDGLKVTIMGRKLPQADWDLVVDSVIHAINTRVLTVHAFSPAELLFGFNPNRTDGEVCPATERAAAAISASLNQGKDPWDEEEKLAQRQLERLVRLDHIRTEAATKIIDLAEKQEASQKPLRYAAPREGVLVLLRRFLLDQRKGNKLEARWEGPYVLADLARHGKTGRLRDINTGELVRVRKGALRERVHLNDLKIYLARRAEEAAGVRLVDILKHEQGTTLERQADVFSLERVRVEGNGSLEWIEEASGVG